MGFDQDGEGLRQYCKTLPNYTQLFQLWQQVISNIEACQADNLTNGGILESARQQVERALGILRGESGNPAVYGSDGDTSANLGQRELGKV
ncbi:MAG TPA: hypothetical protein ENJ35_10340 [Gammaproteobacteria bacterium]|nr:hypothetical protein [Gammaproteobacteria bacterium]